MKMIFILLRLKFLMKNRSGIRNIKSLKWSFHNGYPNNNNRDAAVSSSSQVVTPSILAFTTGRIDGAGLLVFTLDGFPL